MAGRGLGLLAAARGEPERARTHFVDALQRCARVPDAYQWTRACTLESLCALAVAQGWPEARAWVDELLGLTQRSGMNDLAARAHLHSAALGQEAARVLAAELAQGIDSPALRLAVERAGASPLLA